jgi:hypothetical protein
MRVRQHRWRQRRYTSHERHIVIGGAPRSGTTLVRRTLDRHPSICCGPESSILLPGAFHPTSVATSYKLPAAELEAMLAASPSQGAFVDAFAERYRRQRGRPRWAEKTPLNIRCIDWVLERFPEARVIHVIRDGRDVVCSMRQHPDRRWADGAWQRELRPQPLDDLLRRWVHDVGEGIAHRADPRYLEVRYEELVSDPEGVLRGLLRWLDEEWDPAILVEREGKRGPHANTAITTRSVGRWRTDLAADEQALAASIAGPMLARLGYPAD